MASRERECPYLEALDGTGFNPFSFTSTYKCKLTNQEMRADDPMVKFTCYKDDGYYEYRNCSVYKSVN